MTRLPHYPWYPDDYLSSPWVMACDLVDEGIYRRLLDQEWKHPGCQLPDKPDYLRKLCKNAKWSKILSVLECNFVKIEIENGVFFWRNLRIYSEFCKVRALSEQQKLKANLRWNKEKQDATAMQEHQSGISRKDAPQIQNQNHIHIEPKDTVDRSKKRFVPPSTKELTEYCMERNNTVDTHKFIDYYQSNGWRVGKNPMKDWKAAVRTWEKNNYGGSLNAGPQNGGGGREVRLRRAREDAERIRQGRSGVADDVHPHGTDGGGNRPLGGKVIDGSAVEVK